MRAGTVIGTLVLATFALSSLWSAYQLTRCWSIDTWVETPATLLEIKRVTPRTNPDRVRKLYATYSYTFDGRNYTGTRIWVSDNLFAGSFSLDSKEVWANFLCERKAAGRTVSCYVNPKDPAEATLSRDFSRWSIPVALFLALGCVAGMVVLIKKSRVQAQESPVEQRVAGVPNLSRNDGWAR